MYILSAKERWWCVGFFPHRSYRSYLALLNRQLKIWFKKIVQLYAFTCYGSDTPAYETGLYKLYSCTLAYDTPAYMREGSQLSVCYLSIKLAVPCAKKSEIRKNQFGPNVLQCTVYTLSTFLSILRVID